MIRIPAGQMKKQKGFEKPRVCASTERPIRILHVLGVMNRAGMETWLMHVVRHIDGARFHMDFLVHTNTPGAYDEEIKSLGSQVLPCPYSANPWIYGRRFRRLLQEHGPYDIVHSHLHHRSGHVLRLAHRAGVPVRIAHSHNGSDVKGGLLRRLYVKLMGRWLDKYATLGLAVSRRAAEALYGRTWESDPRWGLLYYGFDWSAFHARVKRSEVRAELGLPADAFVVGNVARFEEQKNHRFLIDVFAAIARRAPAARLLLVGDGPLRPAIEREIRLRGLAEKAICAGVRSDIARVMLGAMDVLVFPSLWEGLMIAGLEGQAAGLPLVISDLFSEEFDVVKPLVTRVSLARPADVWADAVLATSGGTATPQPDALRTVEESRFQLRNTVGQLEVVYRDCIAARANSLRLCSGDPASA